MKKSDPIEKDTSTKTGSSCNNEQFRRESRERRERGTLPTDPLYSSAGPFDSAAVGEVHRRRHPSPLDPTLGTNIDVAETPLWPRCHNSVRFHVIIYGLLRTETVFHYLTSFFSFVNRTVFDRHCTDGSMFLREELVSVGSLRNTTSF